ncbi:MAG: membrane protein insertion efficiency factor YidD [Simkaniaceae bacterium]|nr:membrane protein insertion efficiency factor YidD [Simkaniaceae bacterium]
MLFSYTLTAYQPGYVEPWGKDKALAGFQKDEDFIPPKRKDIPSRIAEAVIAFHQNILSPTDGPRSHYRPSSSEYMKQAIRRHGFVMGYLMGCDRLLRENKEHWVYRKTLYGNTEYKYDPVIPK